METLCNGFSPAVARMGNSCWLGVTGVLEGCWRSAGTLRVSQPSDGKLSPTRKELLQKPVDEIRWKPRMKYELVDEEVAVRRGPAPRGAVIA